MQQYKASYSKCLGLKTSFQLRNHVFSSSFQIFRQKHQPETLSTLYVYIYVYIYIHVYIYTHYSPVTVHIFLYYRNTDSTGTQHVFSCFLLHLTCMLKQNQSWGLSSGLEDKNVGLTSDPCQLKGFWKKLAKVQNICQLNFHFFHLTAAEWACLYFRRGKNEAASFCNYDVLLHPSAEDKPTESLSLF